jgi:hypothetical protein
MKSNISVAFNKLYTDPSSLLAKVSTHSKRIISKEKFDAFLKNVQAKKIDFEKIEDKVISNFSMRLKLDIEKCMKIYKKMYEIAKENTNS